MAKTAPQLHRWRMPRELPQTPVLWNAHMARRNDDGHKHRYVVTSWMLEGNGAVAQITDPPERKKRKSQAYMGMTVGLNRSTVNRRINAYSPKRLDTCPVCNGRGGRCCDGTGAVPYWNEEKAAKHSDLMKEARRKRGKKVHEGKRERRINRHVGAIYKHHGGFRVSHSYEMMLQPRRQPVSGQHYDPHLCRPSFPKDRKAAPTYEAQVLTAHFGEKLFDPDAEVNGFCTSLGEFWHPNLVYPRQCECRFGQEHFAFADACPVCGGVKAKRTKRARRSKNPPLPAGQAELVAAAELDLGDEIRIEAGDVVPGECSILEGQAVISGVHFNRGDLLRQGQKLDAGVVTARFRKTKAGFYVKTLPCELCSKRKDGIDPDCWRCAGTGDMYESMPDLPRAYLHFLKTRGILEVFTDDSGKVTKPAGVLYSYTQPRIGRMLGMSVSTVRLIERQLEWLDLLNTIPGEVIKDAAGKIVDRKPHVIEYLPGKLLDDDLVDREKQRIWSQAQALIARSPNPVLRADCDRALEIARQLLMQREGRKHALQVFWKEMRRRLEAAGISPAITSALFPPLKE